MTPGRTTDRSKTTRDDLLIITPPDLDIEEVREWVQPLLDKYKPLEFTWVIDFHARDWEVTGATNWLRDDIHGNTYWVLSPQDPAEHLATCALPGSPRADRIAAYVATQPKIGYVSLHRSL